MIILDLEQGTDEWMKARIGIPTASQFDKIITTKGEPSKQAKKYAYQLAGERVAGFKEETYSNATMARGTELESEARKFYALAYDVEVQEVGFCLDDGKEFGCSPDGLVGEEGGIEIKCPLMATHVGYLLGGKLPTDYIQQVQGSMFVTGRKWWDFVSYYPNMKPFIVRVQRDEVLINALRLALDMLSKDLESIVLEIS